MVCSPNFLLKKLQENKGNVSYGDLADFVNDKVSRMSMVENSKARLRQR